MRLRKERDFNEEILTNKWWILSDNDLVPGVEDEAQSLLHFIILISLWGSIVSMWKWISWYFTGIPLWQLSRSTYHKTFMVMVNKCCSLYRISRRNFRFCMILNFAKDHFFSFFFFFEVDCYGNFFFVLTFKKH